MRIRNLAVDDFFLLNGLDWTPLPKERDSIYLTQAARTYDFERLRWAGYLQIMRGTFYRG